jgi:hypothetical protein
MRLLPILVDQHAVAFCETRTRLTEIHSRLRHALLKVTVWHTHLAPDPAFLEISDSQHTISALDRRVCPGMSV